MRCLQSVGPEAAPVLASLHAAAFPPGDVWSADTIELLLGLKGAFGLVVLDDEEPTGFGLARVVAGEAEILTLAVAPAVRRRGAGAALLHALAAEAAARGARELFLEVAEDNDPARALYAASGAVPVGRRRHYYANGSDALVMRIALAQPGAHADSP